MLKDVQACHLGKYWISGRTIWTFGTLFKKWQKFRRRSVNHYWTNFWDEKWILSNVAKV